MIQNSPPGPALCPSRQLSDCTPQHTWTVWSSFQIRPRCADRRTPTAQMFNNARRPLHRRSRGSFRAHAPGISLIDVGHLVHGTTLVANAIIERKGAKLGLITTRGFRDVLEMGSEQRYDIYDLFLAFPEPLVPRLRRLEATERMAADGSVIIPLDELQLPILAKRLLAEGCEAIAIVFLHSYRNPTHERRAAEIVREACPGLSVSLSCEVVSEIWEYQRTVNHLRKCLCSTAGAPLSHAARGRAVGVGFSRCVATNAFCGRTCLTGYSTRIAHKIARIRARRWGRSQPPSSSHA
jgi:Hydantoinase/oxoprolinase N-terminal region